MFHNILRLLQTGLSVNRPDLLLAVIVKLLPKQKTKQGKPITEQQQQPASVAQTTVPAMPAALQAKPTSTLAALPSASVSNPVAVRVDPRMQKHAVSNVAAAVGLPTPKTPVSWMMSFEQDNDT